MKKKQLYFNSALLAAGAFLFAACTADELASGGVNTTPQLGETVKYGTVKFGNNTTLTIGDKTKSARLVGTMETLANNPAAGLEMCEQPTYDSTTAKIYTESGEIKKFYSDYHRDVVVEKSAECELKSRFTNIEGRIFIKGKLKVTGEAASGGTSGFVVLDGGVLDLSELTTFNCQNRPVMIFEGGTVIWPKEGTLGGRVLTKGDLYIPNLIIQETEGMYIGGDLTCKGIEYTHIGTVHNEGGIHVGHNLTAEYIKLKEKQNIFVGGSPYASKKVEIGPKCLLTVGCRLEAPEIAVNGSDAYLSASSIESDKTHLGSGAVDPGICLPDGGVVDLGELEICGDKVFFYVPDENATALVNCTDCTLSGINDLSQTIDGQFYFNYESISSDKSDEIILADSSKINVATINTVWAEDCNPGFSIDKDDEGSDNEEEQPQPGEAGDIVLDIISDVLEDYTVIADDFAIRINGVYDKSIEVVGGEGHASASLGNIQIEADQLRISLSGLNDTNILPGNDYTYEVWIWVNNVKPANDGTGAYIELFDAAMKNLWVGGQPGADNDPYGEDITANYVTVASPAGYAVRYNVYRGISGSPYTSETNEGLVTPLGDTPYIKVSIHVQKDAKAQANSATAIYPSLKK